MSFPSSPDPVGHHTLPAPADRAFEAIEAIYAAGLDPNRWPDALQALADCFHDVGAVLMFRRDDGSFGTVVSPRLHDANRDYERHWRDRDLRAIRGFESGLLLQREAVTDRHVVTHAEIDSHPIYTQFLAKHGLKWCACVSALPHPRNPVCLSVQRSSAKPPFSDDDLALLERLGRHAEQALRVSIRLLNSEALSASLMQAFAASEQGVLLFDANRALVFRNAEAERAMAEGLSLQDAGFVRALQGTIKAYHEQPFGTVRAEPAAPKPVVVKRAHGTPFILHLLPVTAATLPFVMFGHARIIVLVVDVGRQRALDPALLRDLFGLTLGEASVAALVGNGRTPRHTADDLGVAEDTVRKTLKRVFAKTGINRQTELALLLSRL